LTGSSAKIVRAGYAVRVTGPNAESAVLRAKDIQELQVLVDGLGTGRFAEARASGEALELSLENGVSAELPLADIFSSARTASWVIENVRMMTCVGPELGLIDDGAAVIGGGRVLWAGSRKQLQSCGISLSGTRTHDGGGRLLTPGLIDCHAHPIFAGDRASEFAMRAAGDDYQAIAARGGGINATVLPTRESTTENLVRSTRARMDRALSWGTTTCEAKSGYALTSAGELRLLEVVSAVDATSPSDLSPTLLGAHLVPLEMRESRELYVRAVIEEMIPEAARAELATAVDVYCDEGAFTIDETRSILSAAKAAGLARRAHVGQFCDLGGAELLAQLGGLSADHLEVVSDQGIEALARADVVAVMLPVACVQLKQAPPPVAKLREGGVKLAVATDMNPGSSKCEVLPIAMWLATTRYGMTVSEAWLGVTRHAAQALGRADIGQLEAGMLADMVLWDCAEPAAIPYECGRNLVHAVFKRGVRVEGRLAAPRA